MMYAHARNEDIFISHLRCHLVEGRLITSLKMQYSCSHVVWRRLYIWRVPGERFLGLTFVLWLRSLHRHYLKLFLQISLNVQPCCTTAPSRHKLCLFWEILKKKKKIQKRPRLGYSLQPLVRGTYPSLRSFHLSERFWW